MLLVAATHVAVDNVLERIGFQEEVSPVRCVTEKKFDELPEHIKEMTYERRAGLLTYETGQRSDADRTAWQQRVGQLGSGLSALRQWMNWRATAEQIERDIGELNARLANVLKDVKSQFASEANNAKTAAEAAQDVLAKAVQTPGKQEGGVGAFGQPTRGP